MHRTLMLAALASLVLAPAAAAQWSVGLELGADRVARLIEPRPGTESAPGRPTMSWPAVVRVEHGGTGWRAAVSGSVVNPGLELEGPSITVAVRPAFRIITIAPEVSARVARLGNGGALRAQLAVPVERWSFTDYADPPRWRVGVTGGAALELPVTGRLSGRVGVAIGALFQNPMARTEVTDEYTTTAVWRRSLRMGVLWRL